MSSKLDTIYKQLITATRNQSISWFETSSRSGYITATSKGSIKIEKNDFSDEYSIKFLDSNGFLLDEMGIEKNSDEHSSFKSLYETIRRQLYNVDEKIEDILSELTKQPTLSDIESIFPGTWKNNYRFINNNGGNEILEIRNGKYFVQNKHMFNIENFSINDDKSEITFVKAGLMDDLRRLKNVLRVIKLGQRYEGVETDDIDKNIHTSIVYTRIT